MMIAEAINNDTTGPFKDVHYSNDELDELRISALMHDVGKITTPEHVVDKSTKLETIYDRIYTVKTRMEVLKRDEKIKFLEQKIKLSEEKKFDEIKILQNDYENKIKELEDDMKFLETANIGEEFMADFKIKRVNEIAAKKWIDNGVEKPFLDENEVKNLCIKKGTLTEEERQIINDHVKMTLEMLLKLPFPKKLRRVPEIASNHHEKLNGKGYPRGLSANELSLESRILALADIFEALTASDRPYKDAKTLKEVKNIIGFMVKDKELDKNLVKFFFDTGLHLEYGKKELKPEQINI
jgi:response regulator RpfG family c-di-GMP phosphodiesterase